MPAACQNLRDICRAHAGFPPLDTLKSLGPVYKVIDA
jgi:hypothetical protein